MDINLLCLSIGNSRVAVAAFVSGNLESVRRVPVEDRAAIASAVSEMWAMVAGQADPAVAGASVNPAAVEPIEHIATQITSLRVEWVGRDLDLPIPVLTESPSETGVDRVLNIAAAYEQLGKACVVVDAGTAITIDCCNDAGEFLGGAIAPGVNLMLDALHEKTARLPRVQLAVPDDASLGKNTTQAVLHGVFHGIRGMVQHIVENYASQLRVWPDVIATGGDAQLLFTGWEIVHAIAPDLTLYGLALAYANHHIKHGT
jgi:type III pantothenate kinase